jgi:hypothetical protein
MMKIVAMLAALLGACGTSNGDARGDGMPAPANGTAPAAPANAAAPAPAASAERGVEDPRAFVETTYEAYNADPDAPPEEPAFAYSERLRRLFEAYENWTRQHDDLVGSLDFDWWMNAQDWGPVDVQLAEEQEGRDRRTVVARFSNYGTAVVNRFRFVRVGERWYLDDVVNGDGAAEGWTLSRLLQERPE